MWAAVLMCVVAISRAEAQVANSDETLRDSCHSHFQSVRNAELQVRTVESQSVRMVRLGGNPDIALYERLYRVHQSKVASAKALLRKQESALSGCLANALRDKAQAIAASRPPVSPTPFKARQELRTPALLPQPTYAPTSRDRATVR